MILATPLRHDGEIIGVLEFVNRSVDHPHQPFTPDEMDRAAGIAEVVASLVNAYEAAKIFRDYGDKVFRDTENSDASSVQQWLGSIRSSPEHKEMIEMAVLIREIAGRGDAERRICREVLESVMRYSDSKEGKSFLSF
jgi:hypothetical protein